MARNTNVQLITTDKSSANSEDQDTVIFYKVEERLTEELVFALVGPIGSGCTTSSNALKDILEGEYAYDVHQYHLSKYIPENASLVGEQRSTNLQGSDRVEYLQNVGDKLREKCGNSYLAAKAIEDIAKGRHLDGFEVSANGNQVPKKLRRAHIIDSIKHPEELSKLKRTYGDIFWVIGVFAPLEKRKQRLEQLQNLDIASIDKIMRKDYREDDDYGQKVRDVFHQADFFVRNDQDNQIQLKNLTVRFLEVIFGFPVHTPTTEESSMYAAHAEAARSACLSRQVGAAIVNKGGDLIGLGKNDVPIFGGGLYTEDKKENDHRCFNWQNKICHNDHRKNELYSQIHEKLKRDGLLADKATESAVISAIKKTAAKDLIEYSRAVHAEMDAITSVARNNKPGLLGSTIYVTTYPCHSCARHIVASGIGKVFFIEPYPKSLAAQLHADSISELDNDEGKKVLFLQFSGIAPKNILKLFTGVSTRKDKAGKMISFNKKSASPVVAVSLDDYATHEKLVVAELETYERKASEGSQATIPGF